MDPLEAARAALRVRQGAGARHDAPEAPAEALLWARLGTACVARLLNELPDAALYAPSAVPGWTRAHVVARLGYQARALACLAEGAASGAMQPMHASEEARRVEIENGASLPARALRHLVSHAAAHLDVEWRDLSGPAWDAPLTLPDGSVIATRDTPWLRARALWLGAVDLDAGGSLRDAPEGFLDRLLAEAAATWQGPDRTLIATDRASPIRLGAGGSAIRGRAADLARWITGRGPPAGPAAPGLSHEEPLPGVAVDPTSEL
ncbi:maleylpyruvate isomerase family mycothiol-dependent enzyme [Pseudoxanthobacter sp. M-2]|uniref:maleylpyruvate isomerase family mycothiol-dependent enzyme n=1 Tax=Pseudoxanthobacter sp. M-2 TaxID=3078754 RepID=UPI0038FD2A6B